MSNITHRNPNLSVPMTERNIDTNGRTMRNPNLGAITTPNVAARNFSNFAEGTVLLGKYVVTDKPPITSGEANIYVCEYDGKEYVAKVYNRRDAVNPEILEKLKALDSPYVAKIYETGEHNGMSVTILPYYKLGSLQGKRFSPKQLRRMVIPCMNKALRSLHNVGILHKDLKPANIMMLSSGKGIALIDFGISSVMDNGLSVVVTNSGWTTAYASPEALRGVYLEESDYYSFGITLYELFCGHNPYGNLSATEKARFAAIQKITYPEDMPQDLRELITGLTYNDLTNRDDLTNPNRRWTYDEVKNWLDGKAQPVPGESSASQSATSFGGTDYKFNGKGYGDLNELVQALATSWNEGQKHLQRKLLSGFLTPRNTELAGYCMDAEEEIDRGGNVDIAFWKLLYKLTPDVKEFFWKGRSYPSLQKLGQEMLTRLRRADMSDKNFWDEILGKRLLSQYLESHSQPKEIISAVKSLENTNRDRRDGLISYYHVAYFLAGKKELQVANKNFSTAEQLAEHMNALIGESVEKFEQFCYKLIDSNNKLSEEFEAWLIALGKRNELNSWKQNLQTA